MERLEIQLSDTVPAWQVWSLIPGTNQLINQLTNWSEC